MKTNQVLIRKMGNFDVSQRTSDGMFNATTLLQQWNEHSGQQKGIHHYFEQQNTKEFIQAIINEEFPLSVKSTDNNNLKERNYAKSSLSAIYTKKRGINGGTWMHPLLFIDFAMWLNPAFKVKVLKFVYDELIKYRNDAGDAYREMSGSVSKLVDKTFMPVAIRKIASALNYIVFGSHESDLRNKADEPRMRELFELERKISSLINEGFICSYEQLIGYLRNLWAVKWQPKVLSA